MFYKLKIGLMVLVVFSGLVCGSCLLAQSRVAPVHEGASSLVGTDKGEVGWTKVYVGLRNLSGWIFLIGIVIAGVMFIFGKTQLATMVFVGAIIAWGGAWLIGMLSAALDDNAGSSTVASANASGRSVDGMPLQDWITSYFQAWSRGDMKAYGDHFSDAAKIYYADEKGNVYVWDKQTFIRAQEQILSNEGTPMKESLNGAVDVIANGNVVQVVAPWKLEKASGTTTGENFFTLKKDNDRSWQILSLVIKTDPVTTNP